MNLTNHSIIQPRVRARHTNIHTSNLTIATSTTASTTTTTTTTVTLKLDFNNYFEWEQFTTKDLAAAGVLEHTMQDVESPTTA